MRCVRCDEREKGAGSEREGGPRPEASIDSWISRACLAFFLLFLGMYNILYCVTARWGCTPFRRRIKHHCSIKHYTPPAIGREVTDSEARIYWRLAAAVVVVVVARFPATQALLVHAASPRCILARSLNGSTSREVRSATDNPGLNFADAVYSQARLNEREWICARSKRINSSNCRLSRCVAEKDHRIITEHCVSGV
jgi:hypothetical protein